ncbi:hypothetical protein LWI29_030421 [Acer saccharum]|uniref:Uncharacterized protein n=1 Tax=Acer saccharum TaxID=4024 RepID=A0AA39W3B7_ACESA|nr:hypothetical protein LWI29_030421 [Acer saccharum]
MGENDIRKGESGPEIGKQPSPKYEKGIGLHGPSNRVSKSPSTVKSFIDNMFLSDGVIKVQSGNSGMGRIIDIDGMNSTSSESSKEEFLSFSVEWEAYGEDNINQKMVSWILNDKIFNLAIKCYGMKHGSSKILNMGFSFGACFQWQGGENTKSSEEDGAGPSTQHQVLQNTESSEEDGAGLSTQHLVLKNEESYEEDGAGPSTQHLE